MENKRKLLRITTVPISLKVLIKGQMRFMQQQGFDVLAVSADGKERTDVIHNEGVSHVVVPMSRIISPFQDLASLFALWKLMRKYRPDIVHTHTPKAGLLGMMAAFLCRVPLRLHTVAGLPLMETQGFKRKLLLFTEWLTYRCAHKVYPNSYGLKKFIDENISVSALKLEVIGRGSSNGIDVNFFCRNETLESKAAIIREQYGIDSSWTTFSFVGRIVNDKGIEELLIAFDRVSKQTKAKLILVGHFEPELDPITQKSQEILKDNKDIIHVGFQSDVRPYVVASDIFVFPSYREGFPNVVMQACCLEVACIVSDINGCNEIIAHNETGFIVPVKKHEPLFDAMKQLSDNPDVRKQFGKKARAFVKENFDQSYVWSKLLEAYNQQQ
ncbi:glycosyltransferase family 4 protein [Pseudochryseolinea flava]|uniref:Glycosyltransferase family 1 protein n=1 Tax=Pseudochryseolinea flava TaxID=2059302 RepID=A0A364Y527_9BACT|nr:glycosyltransferase family 4 protein [Pseudochryseolinea flava]RAW01288.1 glycosyltransferase family 1 protein [Pseudochryseolinea flava]